MNRCQTFCHAGTAGAIAHKEARAIQSNPKLDRSCRLFQCLEHLCRRQRTHTDIHVPLNRAVASSHFQPLEVRPRHVGGAADRRAATTRGYRGTGGPSAYSKSLAPGFPQILNRSQKLQIMCRVCALRHQHFGSPRRMTSRRSLDHPRPRTKASEAGAGTSDPSTHTVLTCISCTRTARRFAFLWQVLPVVCMPASVEHTCSLCYSWIALRVQSRFLVVRPHPLGLKELRKM